MRILTALIAAALGTGCYATASGYTPAYVGPSVSVSATTVGPDLVYVSPGVQVIADYDEPIFYTDGFYWRETGGVWYRSSYHNRGWVTWGAPRAVIGIRDRHAYRRYRPAGWSPRRDRGYNPRPTVRDRGYNPRPTVHNRGYNPRPTVRDRGYNPRPANWDNRRDNRVERRDNRRDNRVERRDNRRDNRVERRDNRQDRRQDRRDNRRDRRR